MKKAWEIAIGPSKQLPMNAIMMYMSGNSLQIFSIMMVFMLFKGPIQGLINTNEAFARYETPSTRGRLVAVKLVYVLMQLLLLALGIWKVNAMGLLPYVSTLRFASPDPVANTLIEQNHEIRLACVGIGETASRAGIFRAEGMIKAGSTGAWPTPCPHESSCFLEISNCIMTARDSTNVDFLQIIDGMNFVV